MLCNLHQQIGNSMEEPASDGGEASCDGEEHCEADEDRLPGGELYILLHLRRLTMGEGDRDIILHLWSTIK